MTGDQRGLILPKQLIKYCQKTAERRAWLEKLPAILEELTKRWSLRMDAPFEDGEATCAWVGPVIRADGSSALLKLGMPHMEGAQEIDGLRYWNGDPTVRLLEADDDLGAMLLERCRPGTMLRSEPEPQQDEVIANLAQRLRQRTSLEGLGRFRPLSEMITVWREETLAQERCWPDAGLVREGLRVLLQLADPTPGDTVLATDLHAGNVLRAEREPWLVIDPKPFVGDPAYDLAQHLVNCEERLHADPVGLVERVAELAEVDGERLRLWMFGRASADPREDWGKSMWFDVARKLS